jgi:hypothetical protein
MHETILRLLLTKVLDGIGPQDIAHQTVSWWLAETVNLRILLVQYLLTDEVDVTHNSQVIHGLELWR